MKSLDEIGDSEVRQEGDEFSTMDIALLIANFPFTGELVFEDALCKKKLSFLGAKIFFSNKDEKEEGSVSSSSSGISGSVSRESRSKPSEMLRDDLLLGEAERGANPSSLVGEQLAKMSAIDGDSAS